MQTAEGREQNEAPHAPLPITLRASSVKGSLLLLVCGVFTAVGVWMGLETHDWIGWACALLFGSGCVIATINLLPNAAYLRLEHDGFTYCALFRQHTVQWAATQEFGVMAIRYTKMVAWSFVPGHKMSTTMRKLNRALAGFDSALPDTYGMKAVDLALLMAILRNEFWASHGLKEEDVHDGLLMPMSDNASWAGDSGRLRG